jgi:hypothetical protein
MTTVQILGIGGFATAVVGYFVWPKIRHKFTSMDAPKLPADAPKPPGAYTPPVAAAPAKKSFTKEEFRSRFTVPSSLGGDSVPDPGDETAYYAFLKQVERAEPTGDTNGRSAGSKAGGAASGGPPAPAPKRTAPSEATYEAARQVYVKAYLSAYWDGYWASYRPPSHITVAGCMDWYSQHAHTKHYWKGAA